MTGSSVAVLRNCADRVEAETIRIRLAAAGIQAFITGTDAATALSLGGAPTSRLVRVEVKASDHPRAATLLEQDARRIREAGPWICGRCHEQNEAAFEVCWSCDKPRSEDDVRGRLGESPISDANQDLATSIRVEPSDQSIDHDSNPYRPIIVDGKPPRVKVIRSAEAQESTVEMVRRAALAAIVGMILVPPVVSFYSVFVLIHVNVDAYRDRALRTRLIFAWCLNVVVISAAIFFWFLLT